MLTALVICGTLIFLFLRVEPILREALHLEQRKAEAVTQKKTEPMPIPLLFAALDEKAGWAREDKLKWMQERYEETGDWNQVAASMDNR